MPRLVVSELTTPDLSSADAPVRLDALAAHVTPDWAPRLAEVLAAHRGPTEVHLWVRGPAKTRVYRLGPRVTVRPELWADLEAAVVLTPPA